jgi:hypothetical protein
MQREVSTYYLFLGLHNFLIGLLPFFLPVYLYTHGLEIGGISIFIGVTGLSFCLALYVFDRSRVQSLCTPILISFVAEIVLLLFLVVDAHWLFIAVLNGIYSCLYWTLQRMLFLAGTSEGKSGRKFGNFQIYVLVVLKVGIFCGALLLEHLGIEAVLVVSFAAVGCGLWMMLPGLRGLQGYGVEDRKPISSGELINFSDCYHSRLIFCVDGIFLYLESYFWIITIFLFAGESFLRLGGIVIGLALALAMIFYGIKNRIDSLDSQRLFRVGVLLYVISWMLRGVFSTSATRGATFELVIILLVGFTTAFFRLTFNKRFFDHACRRGSGTSYLFIKSYYSQIMIGVFYTMLGGAIYLLHGTILVLGNFYMGVAAWSILYLFYKPLSSK